MSEENIEKTPIDITKCPQCAKKTRKNTKKGIIYYKCKDCKYSFKILDKQMEIAFKHNDVDSDRIFSYVAVAYTKKAHGVDNIGFHMYNYKENAELKENQTLLQVMNNNPSYWSGGKTEFINLDNDFTKEKFYENFINWFNT